MLSNIWDYVAAVLTNWISWVAAVPFFLEQGYPHLPDKWRVWADSHWPEPRRQWFIKRLAVVGLVVASFQAYAHVNSELKIARSQPNEVTALKRQIEDLTKNRWAPLTLDESSALRAEFRKLVPRKLTVFCNDSNCSDLQDSFILAVKGLGWNESDDRSMDKIDVGIGIWTAHKEYEPVATAIEKATAGRLKMQFHIRQTGVAEIDDGISLAIGRKP
jgi:hypothetical protein